MAELKNKKHEEFCWQYIAHKYHAIPAYMAVYDKATLATARSNAYRLRNTPEIEARIIEITSIICNSLHVNAETIIMELVEIARAEKGDVDYPYQAKLKALELLQKQLGLLTQNVDIKAQVEQVVFEGENELED